MSLKEAFSFRKNKEYEKALAIYRPLWNENPGQFGEWDGWSYAYCLSRISDHAAALEVCRQLFPRFKNTEIIRSLYAKCIYYSQFAKDPLPEISILTRATEAMCELSSPHNPYSMTTRAILKLVKVYMKQKEIHWDSIEKWLQKLDPDLLDDAPFEFTDPKGKKRELASPLEEWYADMIKVKAGLNKPEELLALLKIVRSKNLKWHHSNDIWFMRKEAFAYAQLHDYIKAEKILRRVVAKKHDWFLIYDLAKVVPDKAESLRLLCKAALASGKSELKLKLFESIYSAIKEDETIKKERGLHLCLLAALREENGWGRTDGYIQEALKLGIPYQQQGSSVQLIKILIPFWKSHSGDNVSAHIRMEGIIDYLLPGGNTGFIRSGEGKYYFSINNMNSKPDPGMAVSFVLVDGFDKKKNQPSRVAVRVKYITQKERE